MPTATDTHTDETILAGIDQSEHLGTFIAASLALQKAAITWIKAGMELTANQLTQVRTIPTQLFDYSRNGN